MPTSRLLFVRGLRASLHLGRSDSRELSMGCWFGAGAEPRCVSPCCLRFIWSGCRRSLTLPAPVLYSLKQHFPLYFWIPNASKYLQELQRTLQHLIKTYEMQKRKLKCIIHNLNDQNMQEWKVKTMQMCKISDIKQKYACNLIWIV